MEFPHIGGRTFLTRCICCLVALCMVCICPLLITETLHATPASGRVLTIKTTQDISLADLIASSGYSLADRDLEEFLKDFAELNKNLKGFNVIPKGTFVQLPLGKLKASGIKPTLRGEREPAGKKLEEPRSKQQETEARTRHKERDMGGPRRGQGAKETRLRHEKRKVDAAIVLRTMSGLLYALADVRAVKSEGIRVLSSRGDAELSLDTSSFPLMELADERVILLDYRGILPEEMKDIIEFSWPEYRVFSTHGISDLKGSASTLLDTLGFTSFRNGKIIVGGTPRLDIFPDIVTTTVGNDLLETEIVAVNIVKNGEYGFPSEVKEWLQKRGVRIIELFVGDARLSRQPVKTVSLADSDIRALSARFLNLLGFDVKEGDSLRISDRKEYALRIHTDLTVMPKNKKGVQSIRFSETPETYLSYLQQHGFPVLSLSVHAKRDEVLRKMMDFLSLHYMERPERTTAYITPKKAKYRVSMPGFLVRSGNKTFFFTESVMDEGLSRFLLNGQVTLVRF